MTTSSIRYIGCEDADLDLFESQYVTPEGRCYNSYVILDQQVAVMDSVDPRRTEQWLQQLDKALDGRQPDYLIVQHMEPDHSGSLAAFRRAYPNATIVASAKALQFMAQFNPGTDMGKTQAVKEGDTISLGAHTLQFFTAPMVHWPEVIMTYCPEEKVFFSADAFGKFGVKAADPDDWACEARRYFFNICGKYTAPVSAVMKKLAAFEVQTICPLHGPELEGEALTEAVRLYTIWSNNEVETQGVLVAHASIHGNTARVAEKIGEMLEARGAGKVAVADLCREDMAEVIEDAFRMRKVILCGATYDGDVFPPMHQFLWKLQLKAFQNATVGLVENGTWAPMAAKAMRALVEPMKNVTIVEPVVSIKSALKDEDLPQLEALVNAMLA